MNSEQNLTREEAIAILNTPDEQLNELIAMQILKNINGSMMKNYMEITHLSMIINYPVIALD